MSRTTRGRGSYDHGVREKRGRSTESFLKLPAPKCNNTPTSEKRKSQTGTSSRNSSNSKTNEGKNPSIFGKIWNYCGLYTANTDKESGGDDETDAESEPPSDDSDEIPPTKILRSSPRSPPSSSREDLRIQILKQWCRSKKSSNSIIKKNSPGSPNLKPKQPFGKRGKKKHHTPPPRRDLLNLKNIADAIELPPSAYPGSEDKLLWYCESCSCFHALTSTHAMTPFTKKHGLCMRDVEQDGDCFYSCVIQCLKTDSALTRAEEGHLTVDKLRDLVARRMTEDQLDFYRMEAEASPKAAHLDFIRPVNPAGIVNNTSATPSRRSKGSIIEKDIQQCVKRDTATARNSARFATVEMSIGANRPEVDSVIKLREYVRKEGRLCGLGNCLWADSFAQMVVAESFRLTILLIDMERDQGCFPFRFMHRFNKDSDFDGDRNISDSGDNEQHKMKKRRGRVESINISPIATASIVGNKGERFIILKRQGPVGHFQYVERTEDGCAVFSQKDLPTVIKTLWGLL